MSSGVSKKVEAIEERLLTFFEPIKPYLPGIARFLLVVTYIEDSIRIV